MKKTDIQKIRQLLISLEWIHVAFHEDDYFCPSCKRSKESGHYKDCRLKQALALLPCETCGGTREKPDSYIKWHRGLLIEDRNLGYGPITRTGKQKRQLYQMYVDSFSPCPYGQF